MKDKPRKIVKKFNFIVCSFIVVICLFVLVKMVVADHIVLDKVLNQQAILIEKNASEYNLRVNSNVDDFTLYIKTENLCNKGNNELGVYQQTNWFSIDPMQRYLCMYGGFNYAKWTFVDEYGKKTVIDKNDVLYNDMFDTTLNNACKCIVEIPEGSVGAKVTYYKSGRESIKYIKDIVHNFIKGNFGESINEFWQVVDYYRNLKRGELFITYGMVPSSHMTNNTYTVDFGKLSAGDDLIYKNENGWVISRNQVEVKQIKSDMYLQAGFSIVCSKRNSLLFSYGEEKKKDDEGIYGVKYNLVDNAIVCERIEDAIGLHTNYMFGNQYALPYDNDFDNIYPWSEIKSCYLDDEGNVYYNYADYSGEGNLNAMVEIPVFYISRTVSDNQEYICISKEWHEGFDIDPAFVTNKGVCDKIYVSKYLASFVEDNIGSYAETVPAIDVSLETIDSMVNEKGNNWDELDLVTLNMVQRLWLVETAVKNTQSVFEGYTESTFIWSNADDPKYAVESKPNSNTIKIKKNDYTAKFEVGDNVIVITYQKDNEYSAYKFFTENYINDDKKWQRKITSIGDDEEYLDISFSGEPIDIVCGESLIANLPQSCGVTDSIGYHTGTERGIIGKNSFKYRNIENIWGNVCTVLQGVRVENRTAIVEYPNGTESKLAYVLPEQSKGGSVAKSFECAISKMCFDNDNPLVMLPEKIGCGATLTNNFGDWFSMPETDVYDVAKQAKCVTYGMTWDLASYAGLFAYRVHPTYSESRVENGARIIYRR